jgi:hypothetical protein
VSGATRLECETRRRRSEWRPRGLAVLADIEESQRAQGATPPDDDELDRAVAEVRAYRAERRRAAG